VEPSGATFSNIDTNTRSGATGATFGLGDAIYAVTQTLGIPHCPPCARRRERLNRLWHIANAPDPVTAYILSLSLQEKPHGKDTAENPDA
jgi:hypothetical protein